MSMFPTTQNSTTDLVSALKGSQIQSNANQAGGKSFMKFDFKSGDYTFGRENEEITGDEIVINTYTFTHGWTIWANGKPVKTAVPFNQQLPMEPAPIDGNAASESRSFEARFMDDEDTIIVFDTNSYGGRKGCDTVFGEISNRANQGEGEFIFPIVKLESESYKAQQGSTIHNPVFTVVGWMNEEGQRQDGMKEQLDAPEEVAEEAPKRRRRKV